MKHQPYGKCPYPKEHEWLQLGDSELRAAEVLHNGEDVLLRQVRHHCHGAVECYLKTFLKHQGVERPIHKLDALLGGCIGADPAFRTIRNAVNALARDYPPNLSGKDESNDPTCAAEGKLENLTGQLSCESSEQTRYNPQNTFEADDANDWLDRVSEVREFVKKRLSLEEE
ncbi:HEPN domain-containing protein [bacterium]|nr:HEPN domain-containing protein [bacterium]